MIKQISTCENEIILKKTLLFLRWYAIVLVSKTGLYLYVGFNLGTANAAVERSVL